MGAIVSSSAGNHDNVNNEPPPKDPQNVSDEEWRSRLTPLQYDVARKGGTERAFTGQLASVPPGGKYGCVCCGASLFKPETKFDSGSGWPSFHSAEPAVAERVDISHGMVRKEVLCDKCGAHLGHVFDDGPNPTGLRYCINAASLRTVAEVGGGKAGEKSED